MTKRKRPRHEPTASSTEWAECYIPGQSAERATSRRRRTKSDRPIGSALVSPELTDEEVSVLCDVERDGSTKSGKQPVVQSLIERGFLDSSEDPLARVKLTSFAQQLLSKRGVGLNES